MHTNFNFGSLIAKIAREECNSGICLLKDLEKGPFLVGGDKDEHDRDFQGTCLCRRAGRPTGRAAPRRLAAGMRAYRGHRRRCWNSALSISRRHLNHVQRRSRHQVQAGPRPSLRLKLSDDATERGRRAEPPQGHAGINIAVRLEGIADPGGILISEKVYSEVEGKLDAGFEDRGEQQLKNISKPVRAYAVRAGAYSAPTEGLSAAPPLRDKPSIAVLPFENMSGDPEQEYFADGMVEEIITALSQMVVRDRSQFEFHFQG
jgi:hypothetical protein